MNDSNNKEINNKNYKEGNRYENRKLLYIILLIFLILNLFCSPFNNENNSNYIINNINEKKINEPNLNINKNEKKNSPLKVEKENNDKKDKKEDNKIKNKNLNNNKINKENNNEIIKNNKQKMKYINKNTRNFFQKFEMFSLFGFIGILYILMWHNSNKLEEERNDEQENESLKYKNKYNLLKDYEEDDYYENI